MTTEMNTVELEKPLYTLEVAAEMLGSTTGTLIAYEDLGVAIRSVAGLCRGRFTLRDIVRVRAIARLRARYGMNLAGARQMIRCLQLLDAHRIPRPGELRHLDLEYVRI